MLNIGIFIPARNVSKTLTNTLDRIPENIKKNVKEIFILDNDSIDATYDTAVEYKIKNKLHNLKIYKNNTNLGYGGNQKKAYDYAIDQNFEIIVMLHGDAQYAPEYLPQILQPLIDGKTDMVFGSRFISNPLKGGMPLWRYIGNKILTKIENSVLGINLSEFHSGYRAFNVSALKKLPFEKLSNNFQFDTEIIIQFVQGNMKISEVDIPTHYDRESSSISKSELCTYSTSILINMIKFFFHKKNIWKQEKFIV